VFLVCAPTRAQQPDSPVKPESVPGVPVQVEGRKDWIGREEEYEAFLKTAKVERVDAVPVGVTKPKRAFVAPGGLAGSFVFKELMPSRKSGYFESYKSEIAAYQLDKLLELGMVPPKVERTVDDQLGVAIMWVAPATSFKDSGGMPKVPPMHQARFTAQLTRAKMFHNLVGDIDPNLGNWLVDPGWNLILIDHSRALTKTRNLVHKMQAKDDALWARAMAFTEESLTAAVGQWLGRDEIRALLERRAKMQTEFDKLARKR
jgi:hypothetical protein